MLLAKPGRAWPGCCFQGRLHRTGTGAATATQPSALSSSERAQGTALPQGQLSASSADPLLGSPLLSWLADSFF